MTDFIITIVLLVFGLWFADKLIEALGGNTELDKALELLEESQNEVQDAADALIGALVKKEQEAI